jgi:hypothetical protein
LGFSSPARSATTVAARRNHFSRRCREHRRRR